MSKMKKLTSLLFVLVFATALAGCSSSSKGSGDTDVKSEGVMTYEEYMAAPLDSQVVDDFYLAGPLRFVAGNFDLGANSQLFIILF